MRRLIGRMRPRLRGQFNDILFFSGCGLIVGAFGWLAPVAGMFAAGVALVALSITLERGAGE